MRTDTALRAEVCYPIGTAPTGRAGGIRCVSEPSGLRVHLWGDVDGALRPQASGAMAQIMGRDGDVQLDVSRVSFIDSAGMAFILQVHFLCTSQGRTVVLVDPSPVIRDLLDLIGLTGVVEITSAGSTAP